MKKFILLLSVLLILSGCFLQQESVETQATNTVLVEEITSRPSLSLTTVVFNVTDLEDKDKTVDFGFEFQDHRLTRDSEVVDVMQLQNTSVNVTGLVNESLGKYKDAVSYTDSNGTRVINYTTNNESVLCQDKNGTLFGCDYILGDKTVLKESTGVVGTTTVLRYEDVTYTKSKVIVDGLKIEPKAEGFPLPKSSTSQFKVTFTHTPTFGVSVPVGVGKYNITVYDASTGSLVGVLDPWWNTTFNNRINITTNASLVDSNENDFPYYFDLSLISDSGFWNSVQGDGCDIRVTDSGANELPIEVVNINTTAQDGELYFKNETDSAADKVYSLYFNTSGTMSCPGNTDSNGRNNVWTVYEAVWHLGESSGSAVDSTGNGNTGTVDATQGSTGQIGDAYDFDGSSDEVSIGPIISNAYSNDYSITAWVNTDDNSNTQAPYAQGNTGDPQPQTTFQLRDSGEIAIYSARTGGSTADFYVTTTTPISNNIWHYIGVTYDSTGSRSYELYHNGWSQAKTEISKQLDADQTMDTGNIGVLERSDTVQRFDGTIDEVRISLSNLGANWISSEYDMQNSNSGFWTVNTVETVTPPNTPPAFTTSPSIFTPTDNNLSSEDLNLTFTPSDVDGDSVTANITWLNDKFSNEIDDFEDNNINEYTTDEGTLIEVTDSQSFNGSFSLFLGNESDDFHGETIQVRSQSGLSNYPSKGSKFKFYVRPAFIGISQSVVMLFGTQDSSNYYGVELFSSPMRLIKDGSSLNSTSLSGSGVSEDEWHEVIVHWRNDGFINASVYNSTGFLLGSVSATDSEYSSGGIGWRVTATPSGGVRDASAYFDFSNMGDQFTDNGNVVTLDSQNSFNLGSGNTSAGENWTATVNLNDGTASTTESSNTLTILSAAVTCDFTTTTTLTNEVRDCTGKVINVSGNIALNLVNSTIQCDGYNIELDAEVNIDLDSDVCS